MAATKKKATKKTAKKPAAKAVEEVLAKVDASIEAGKEKVTYEDEGAGREALRSAEKDEHVQQDRIPGTRRRDITALPEFVIDDRTGERRRAFTTPSSEFHYCWVEGGEITNFKAIGYRMVPYQGGRGGLPAPGFSGTAMYECDISNHIKLGDVYLMYCDLRLYNDLEEEDRQMADRLTRLGATNFHNLGYRHGIKTNEEIDGIQMSN